MREKLLELFSQAYPSDLHIIQLDNGPSHQAKDLVIPENIILLFQPSHCPQVNPIERLWETIKDELKWVLFDDLDDLRNSLQSVLQKLSQKAVASITGWKFIVDALCVAGI